MTLLYLANFGVNYSKCFFMMSHQISQNSKLHSSSNDDILQGCPSTPIYPDLPIPPQQEPPDGGLRAWAVMLASFFTNGILFGTINSSGVIFDVLKKQLEAEGVENPSSKASLCLSLTIGMTFMMSVVSGVLTDKMGVRKTTFIGGALATLGMFLSSVVYNRVSSYLILTWFSKLIIFSTEWNNLWS